MVGTELETFFERLMAEPHGGLEGPPSIRTRLALSTTLDQLRSATAVNGGSTIAGLAAHLDRAPDGVSDDTFIAGLVSDPEALYDLEAAQSFIDRVSLEECPVPEALIRTVVADATDRGKIAISSARQNQGSLRWKSPLLWVSAITALILLAVVGKYTYESAARQSVASASSEPVSGTIIQGTVPQQRVGPTVPSGSSLSNPSIVPDKQAAPPAYTSPDPPVPVTSHFVTAADYPAISTRLQEQGTVKVKYLVQMDGTVGDCQVDVSSGYPRLDDAACVMVRRRWLFKPATVMGGSPVEAWLDAAITFSLR